MTTWTLADYKGWDDVFVLGNNMEHTITVDIPDDYDRDRKVILGYVIYYQGSPISTSARYDIDFNDIVVHDEASVVMGGNSHVRWKVIDGNKLNVGSNTIQFRTGEVGFPIILSDVVLSFQRTVTTS